MALNKQTKWTKVETHLGNIIEKQKYNSNLKGSKMLYKI